MSSSHVSRTSNKLGQLIARVLAGAWRSQNLTPLDLSESELDQVTPLLIASGAVALSWRRVSGTTLRDCSSAEILHQAYRLQSLQSEVQEQKIEKVFRVLREASVEAILAKGWAAAGLYPDRTLRPYGDIDICVGPENHQLVVELFKGPETRDCFIDLHLNFSEIGDRKFEELLARSKQVGLGQERIRVLGLEDHLALLCIHFLKHGGWRPLWLCDIGAAIESLPADFKWDIWRGRSRQRERWLSSVLGLAHELLETNLDAVPQDIRPGTLPDWLVKSILFHWSNLLPGDQMPMRAPRLMSHNLKSGRNILKGLLERWPDPITATFNRNGQFNNYPRLPYQLTDYIFLTIKYLVQLPAKLRN